MADRMTGCGICAGCIGMGPRDDGTPCAYDCGARATTPWGTCQRCEDEATGRDIEDDEEEDGGD